MTLRTAGLMLAIATFAAFPARPTAQGGSAGPQTIVDLGTLGHDLSHAVAVNNKGQVIGWIADNFTPFRGVFIWEDGVMRELTGPPDLRFDDARGINDRGQIAGYATDAATFRSVAVIWEDGVLTPLPTPAGDAGCGGEAINDRGDVAGTCVTPAGDGVLYHAVVWRDGTIVDLGTVPGGGGTIPIAINNRGVVLGYVSTPEGGSAGFFIWTDGVLTRLDPTLTAVDLNDRGQIAASARVPPNVWIEALVIDDGRIVRLPSLPSGGHCLAEAINAHGSVGGWCGGVFPVVWTRGELHTLPGLSDFFATVTDINDRGTAVGNATTPDGYTHAVLWPGAAKHPPRRVDR